MSKVKGIKRLIAIARGNARREIQQLRDSAFGPVGRADSGSGYAGGYIAALDDVLLALNGVRPGRNGWWDNKESEEQ
jgi:hypothetical protein